MYIKKIIKLLFKIKLLDKKNNDMVKEDNAMKCNDRKQRIGQNEHVWVAMTTLKKDGSR